MGSTATTKVEIEQVATEPATVERREEGEPLEERQLSSASKARLLSLEELEKRMRGLEDRMRAIVVEASRGEADSAKASLRQLAGALDRMQFESIDAIVTSDLKSGQSHAKHYRKALHARVDALRSHLEEVYTELVNNEWVKLDATPGAEPGESPETQGEAEPTEAEATQKTDGGQEALDQAARSTSIPINFVDSRGDDDDDEPVRRQTIPSLKAKRFGKRRPGQQRSASVAPRAAPRVVYTEPVVRSRDDVYAAPLYYDAPRASVHRPRYYYGVPIRRTAYPTPFFF